MAGQPPTPLIKWEADPPLSLKPFSNGCLLYHVWKVTKFRGQVSGPSLEDKARGRLLEDISIALRRHSLCQSLLVGLIQITRHLSKPTAGVVYANTMQMVNRCQEDIFLQYPKFIGLMSIQENPDQSAIICAFPPLHLRSSVGMALC